ncbi:hypothetical protein MPSI1_003907 [Malassezia psittaci]|uniref:WLM domain-containing protein n=1 Tax=Malassezia psittaci TaxID=1821823 RepID=A0AAF0FEV3_9BASI|nr:hypothetical protein MPSI1_003907 [Malassezia psittaci]
MPIRGRGKFPTTKLQARKHEEKGGVIEKYIALQRPHSDTAINMLREIGAKVKVLMQRYGWKLPVLAEMYPRSANLLGLNINQGAKICLRLRRANQADLFLEREEVIRTMLHELAHNVRGPHDVQFYETLATLTNEYETAERLGYWSGSGFLSQGARLGGRGHHLTPAQRRQVAAEQAARRAKNASRGSARLGGSSMKDRSLRELAAEVRLASLTKAALRRIQDAKTCASATSSEAQAIKEQTDTAEREAITVVDSDEDTDNDTLTQTPYTSTIPTHAGSPPSSPTSRPEIPIGSQHNPIILS